MRVTPHSALAISTCALALLSQISSVHSVGGRVTKSTFSKEYIEKNKDNLFLSNIRWGGGNDLDLSFARVDWNGRDAFLKCDKTLKEIAAFNALKEMKENLAKKKLEGAYAIGQQNVMNPLHQFAFTKDGPVDINLADPKQTILPDIIKGLLYLYNARIVHMDIAPRNIILHQDSNGKYIPNIIDYDSVIVFDEKTDDWARINPNNKEYLLLDPPQKYLACHYFTFAITEFLNAFFFINHDTFKKGSELSESAAVEKLKEFNERLITAGLKKRVPGLPLKLPDVKPVLPSMRYLFKAMYTLELDPFTCSAPMRALRGLEPRPDIPSRPNSPSFQW
ncbi:hypothetical protein BDF22DRAFT_745068 [Syncephalis plumigaleata]|nr:hypothetical protein BDF22DRAFT_745068 [Syncephalis plumigaleata]